MSNQSQTNIDLRNLTKYPEFYALKQELVKFCDTMDSIHDINLSGPSRVGLEQEIFGRQWAARKVRDLLKQLGVLQDFKQSKDRTFE